MKLMHSEWQSRIRHWVRVLKEDLYEPLGEISWGAYRTNEHLSPETAASCPFQPVETGYTWGNTWEYCWFRGSVVLPERAEGKRIVLNLNPDGESTLFVNGKSFGTFRSDAAINDIGEPHHYMVDNVLTRSGKAGDRFDILMETYAGHFFPETAPGVAVGPVLPDKGLYDDPLTEGKRRTLGLCTYGIWNEDAYQLFMDVDTLGRLLSVLDPSSLRSAKIADALEQFTLTVDYEQGSEERNATYRKARQLLRPVMEAQNGSTVPEFYAVGNAHLDLAWLWPMAETHRKTSRTFAAQLRLMEEYPEYKFIQSQPASYEMCREHYPELFQRIRDMAQKGQWIPEGGMWVEPDTNMAGGEALIRQLMYGKRYYQEVFGVDSQVLWLPDTFGYTAALPQILVGCGMKYLVTQKIFWSYNEGEQFPYHYFNWQGMDGSTIVSFLPTSYTYKMSPEQVNQTWKNRTQTRDLDAFLYPYGYGDGGGGPARDYIEYALRQKNLEGGAKVKLASPREFFEDMQAKGGPKHTYVGELYFTAHRGTYTTQALTKRNNRKSELAMRELELWSAISTLQGGEYPTEAAERLWKTVLLHQFHDILPGSSIGRVYREAAEVYAGLLSEANLLAKSARQKLADPEPEAVTFFNSLSFPRNALVSLPEHFQTGARTIDGAILPVVNGKTVISLPPCGAVSLRPVQLDAAAPLSAWVSREGENFVLENALVRAAVNHRGEVTSFILKENGREFAAGTMNRLLLYKDVPRIFDAWDIDSNYILQEVDGAYNISVEILEQGMEAVLRVTGAISHSRFTQYIRLAKDSDVLVFETEVDWNELHRLLKVGFPVDVHGENAINEMQFGFVQRPTHRSRPYDKDRFEVPNHRYSALCDGSHGAAVLNDCKYGISVNSNQLELTLLRAAATPDMRSDNHVHHFTYGFTAWEGSFADCDVIRRGYELNVPPVQEQGSLDLCFLEIDKPNVFADTIKLAEDGSSDLIIRLYEGKKAAVDAKLRLNLPSYTAVCCDMLENPIAAPMQAENGTVDLSFRAFEIKTVRIRR